jgi:hypothetical protein
MRRRENLVLYKSFNTLWVDNKAKACRQRKILHALAASTMQSRQFFACMLREQLFELKNEDTIKNSENLRYSYAC